MKRKKEFCRKLQKEKGETEFCWQVKEREKRKTKEVLQELSPQKMGLSNGNEISVRLEASDKR